MRKFILPLVALALASAPAVVGAQPLPATINGNLTFLGDVGANGAIGGAAVGPYHAKFTGYASVPGYTPLNSNDAIIWCVDFNHLAPTKNVADTYVASRIFTAPGAPAIDLSQTRMGTANLLMYQRAAWLIEQYDPTGATAFTAGNIQGTLWQLFGGGPTTGASSGDAYATNLLGLVPTTGLALSREWYVMSDCMTGRDCVSNQEFLTSRVTTAPEPGTYALMTAGLVAIGVISRRRRAKAPAT